MSLNKIEKKNNFNLKYKLHDTLIRQREITKNKYNKKKLLVVVNLI